jgi:hypothetical protein
LNLVEQVASNSTQTSKRTTAADTLNIMRGLKEYLRSSNCIHCKGILRRIIFEENSEAGSTGTQPTEHGNRIADATNPTEGKLNPTEGQLQCQIGQTAN